MAQIIYFTPLCILAIAWLLQLYYQLAVYSKLRAYSIPSLQYTRNFPPLSVVICARNEEENLSEFLPFILEQDYPDFEVVVVNDCSSDDSEWLLKTFSEKYKNLEVVNIKEHPRYKHGKKFALTIGIKAAKNNHLVFTDADCKPASTKWLRHIGSSFDEGKEIVLGYSPYLKVGGLFNQYLRFEGLYRAISYLSYALKGHAYMGVGKNMGYTKNLFFKGKGFASHMHLASGYDDLFVNQNATKTNTNICIHPEAHVSSAQKPRLSKYYSEKLRQYWTSKAYRGLHRRMLKSQVLSALFFYTFLILCFFIYPELWQFLLASYLFRLLIQVIVYRPILKKLGVLDIMAYLPILDIVYYFNSFITGFLSLFRRTVK